MTQIFMLAARFPSGAADDAEEARRRSEHTRLVLRGHELDCTVSLSLRDADHPLPVRHELIVYPTAFSTQLERLPFDRDVVTSHDVRGLGDQLYGLLGRFRGYEAAAVGWDPETRLGMEEWEAEWERSELPSLCAGTSGLVLSTSWCDRWGLDERFVPFGPTHRWSPYEGTPIWWR